MDYINYVKQYPMSMGGMGGVVGSYNFRSGASGDYDPCTGGGGAGASTRGIMAGGSNSMAAVIQYITLSTLGNSADFGTVSSGGGESCMGGGSSHIRFVMGGLASPNANDEIEYVHFSTLGNSIDFGDLLAAQQIGGCASNGHGGLSKCQKLE